MERKREQRKEKEKGQRLGSKEKGRKKPLIIFHTFIFGFLRIGLCLSVCVSLVNLCVVQMQ